MKKAVIFALSICFMFLFSFAVFAADGTEIEPNDTKGTATWIELNKTYTGEIGSYEKYKQNNYEDDVDYYAISLEAGQMYRVNMSGFNDFLASTTAMVGLYGNSSLEYFNYEMNDSNRDYFAFIAENTGTYYIEVGNYVNYKTEKRCNYSLMVEKYKMPITDVDINLYIHDEPYEYRGEPIEVNAYIYNKNYKELKKNKDYTITYKNNLNVGTATVTITGIGNYTGTYSESFTILPIKIQTAIPRTSENGYTYAGKEVRPRFTGWVYHDRVELIEGIDYTVSFINNNKPGHAKAVLTGIGNFTGSDTVEFYINESKSSNLFPDVSDPTKSYYKPVYWAARKGITVGYSDGYFGPTDSCTRAQFVTFIWRMAGKPAPSASSSAFSDVSTGTSSFKPIMWAVEKGIIVGYKDGTFRPSAKVTRRQVAVMLWRWQGKPSASKSAPFIDVSRSDNAYKAIQWGSEAGVVKGSNDNEGRSVFKPDDNCQRQQIVTFLYRFARDVQGEKVD